jgi:hypothetical protein
MSSHQTDRLQSGNCIRTRLSICGWSSKDFPTARPVNVRAQIEHAGSTMMNGFALEMHFPSFPWYFWAKPAPAKVRHARRHPRRVLPNSFLLFTLLAHVRHLIDRSITCSFLTSDREIFFAASILRCTSSRLPAQTTWGLRHAWTFRCVGSTVCKL